MGSERKRRVVLPLCPHVSVMGFFCRYERTKMHPLPIGQRNPRLELFANNGNPQETRLAPGFSFPPVLSVDGKGGVAKIANSVVSPFAVDMVDDAAGPFSMNVKPSKSVRLPVFPHKPNAAIAFAACMPGDLPTFRKPASAFAPRKNASFSIIMQQLFQECLHFCIVGLSHYVAPSKRFFGQGTGASGKCYFPRLNIMETV